MATGVAPADRPAYRRRLDAQPPLAMDATHPGAPMTLSTPETVCPGRALEAAAAPVHGCVTAEDPTTLVEMNVGSRNLDGACPLAVDLGGWTYDNPPAIRQARAKYQRFQRYVLRHPN